MGSIKMGDLIIPITRKSVYSIGTIVIASFNEENNWYCHATGIDYDLKEKDWILPIRYDRNDDYRKTDESNLLIPKQILKIRKDDGVIIVTDKNSMSTSKQRGWFKDQVVPINRRGNYIYIHGAKLTIEEYQKEYNIKELPIDLDKDRSTSFTPPIIKKEFLSKSLLNLWVKEEHIRKYCGEYRHALKKIILITPEILMTYDSEKSFLDSDLFCLVNDSACRIEDIPECEIPKKSKPIEYYNFCSNNGFEWDKIRPITEGLMGSSTLQDIEAQSDVGPGEYAGVIIEKLPKNITTYKGCHNPMFPVDNIRPRKEEPSW